MKQAIILNDDDVKVALAEYYNVSYDRVSHTESGYIVVGVEPEVRQDGC